MQETPIGWTDISANWLRYRDPDGNVVHACVRISEGCRFCYACTLAGRWGRKGKDFTAENMKPLTPFFDVEGAHKFLRSRTPSGKKVFISDMTDLFGEWVPDEIILQHFALFALRPDVTFQVLTKRAKRMCAEVSALDFQQRVELYADQMLLNAAGLGTFVPEWPLPNVHLGVSIEDQKNADERLPWLLETPAAVRWASIEPLLAPVDLAQIVIAYFKNERTGADYLSRRRPHAANATVMAAVNAMTGEAKARVEFDEPFCLTGETTGRLDGVVIGGESGPGHREMPLVDAVVLAEAARDAGLAVYIKQDSGPRPGKQGRIPDDIWKLKEWSA